MNRLSEDEKMILAVLGLIIIIIVSGFIVLTTQKITVSVTGENWQREIKIENYLPRKRTD